MVHHLEMYAILYAKRMYCTWLNGHVLCRQKPFYAQHSLLLHESHSCTYLHTHTHAHTHRLLLFDETRLLKLCDFGKAKVLKQPTESGSLVGTAYYIAPEVMHCKLQYSTCSVYCRMIQYIMSYLLHVQCFQLREAIFYFTVLCS